jgi:ABC-type nickel/cobalt efflux system permease component RcnA
MTDSLALLYGTAASIGFLHTLLGPDHYLPFIAMSRAGGWSLRKTVLVTVLCGIGHVLGSIVLGVIGIVLGVAAFRLETVEGFRGDLAGWLLLAFGFVYFVWGVRRAIRNKPHTHWHRHADGTAHEHVHVHADEHVHVHGAEPARDRTEPPALGVRNDKMQGHVRRTDTMTPWVLFTIFVFGPCEPLIPLLMYPAAKGSSWGVVVVSAVFALATVATMTATVVLAYFAVGRMAFTGMVRYSHALAGFVVLLCGAAVKVGL